MIFNVNIPQFKIHLSISKQIKSAHKKYNQTINEKKNKKCLINSNCFT